MQVGLSEWLEKVSKLKKNSEKVDAIKANDTLPVRVILQGAFDPNVKWLLPEGDVPYAPNKLTDQEHILINEAPKLRYYVDGFYPGLKQVRRETMFIELLERLAPADARLLVAVKDKKLPFPGITRQIVQQALPDLFAEEAPEALKREDESV